MELLLFIVLFLILGLTMFSKEIITWIFVKKLIYALVFALTLMLLFFSGIEAVLGVLSFLLGISLLIFIITIDYSQLFKTAIIMILLVPVFIILDLEKITKLISYGAFLSLVTISIKVFFYEKIFQP